MTITRILIVTLVGVTALVMTAFGVIEYSRDHTIRIDALRAKLDSITTQLSIALVNPMWTFNTTDITKIVDSYMKDKEVYVVFIEDEKGVIGRIKSGNGEAAPLHGRLFPKGKFFSEKEIFFKGEKIGVLGVGLTQEYMDKELRTSLLNLLSSFFILNISLVSILFFVLMRAVFNPLKIIENYAIQMSGSFGMEDIRINGHGFARELDNLKNSIQNMTGQLKARYHELKASQAALKETEKKYREIFNNASEGIFQTTREGRLILANPALAAMLGYDSSRELVDSVADIARDVYVDASQRDEIINIINNEKQIRHFETKMLRKDETVISVSISAHSVFDEQNNFMYYEGMVEDITQRKQAEELKIEKEAVEATARAKSIFLASMSHELRTPISAVMGLTSLALKTDLSDKQQDYLKKIESASRDLLGIINDVLDFSKIEAGELSMDRIFFPLEDVWVGLSDIFADKCAEKGLRLHFHGEDDVPSGLIGDPLRVRQILINLIGNALKFTQKGEIVVRAGLAMKSRNRVMLKFSVKDTGIGIDQKNITKIFSPFTQGEPFITRKYGGTGLGLSICRQLVEMMGGEIWVESKPGQGACFTFTACFGLQSRGQEPESPRPDERRIAGKGGLRGARVLLVEDNSINRQIATEMLENKGIIVENARDGREAVRLFSSRAADSLLKFDAVLMDVQMPEMNGFEATRKIRQWESKNPRADGVERASGIPIIAMTAHAMMGDRETCIISGMNDYITKPIDHNRLFGTLRKWIVTGSGRVHPIEKGGEVAEQSTVAIKERESDAGAVDFFGPKTLPGLDITKGIERLQGNKSLYFKLLHEFVQDHANDIEKIGRALQEEELEVAQRLIHTFKGVAKSIAAVDLSAVAEDIEGAIKKGKPVKDSLLDTARMMVAEIAESIARLKDPRDEGPGEPCVDGPSADFGEITRLILEMYRLLQKNRIDADKYLSRLKAILIHAGLGTLARELEISLGQFDFKGARAGMEKIAAELNISLERGTDDNANAS